MDGRYAVGRGVAAPKENGMINRGARARPPFPGIQARNSTMPKNKERPVTGRADILPGVYPFSRETSGMTIKRTAETQGAGG